MKKLYCFIVFGLFVFGALLFGNEVKAAANADGSVEVNAENFPDESFRNFILKIYDQDGDNALSKEELDKVTIMTLE